MTLPHALRLPSLWPAPKESVVHVVILIVYAFTAWLALLAWCVIVGTPVPLWVVLCVAPFVISGVIVALVALDLALHWYAGREIRRAEERTAAAKQAHEDAMERRRHRGSR